ncbi:MAG TPA: SDR family NAD(P)-dependent oxidoreductase, partial [Terriglobales bacterium]|nr:SDR family NAD(P)-dependent oxidoreductase [Terriglobales bacterium]
MRMDGNTIFITGGGEGIGRGLAEAFHELGNQVIIASRRESVLKAVCEANPGMRYYVLDVADPEQIRAVAAQAIADFPKLNCVIANAGVQRLYSFAAETMPDDHVIAEEIEINLLGVIRTITAFLPHLRKQESATVIQLTSGLAYVPRSACAVYCATKAAIHSLS